MSETIDQKVVEMRFDNQQFERGVSQSLKSLDRLNSSIKMDGMADGIRGLSIASNSVDFSNISSGMDMMTEKSNLLSRVINQVLIGSLRRFGEETEQWFARTVKSMSGLEAMQSGMDKFGNKTTSVATIVAQGYALEDVNDALNKLNWFSDETSYNFTDMVSNIAKFTAVNVPLNEAAVAMEGIANWAAISGQNAQTASSAMYNISQAMSAGAMKMQDWKSIQIANMDTTMFREQAVEAAKNANVIKEVTDGVYEYQGKRYTQAQLFSEGLSKGWMNKDVMMATFTKYASAVEDIYNYTDEYNVSASEAIEQLGDSIDEFGVKAFKAAQEARTWADVIDSVKDATSTGWMNTFELIIGNQAEATAFFTTMANMLWEVFAAGAETRNSILEVWRSTDDGDIDGRAELLRGFVNILQAIKNLATPVIDAFHYIFDPEGLRGINDELERNDQYIQTIGKNLKIITTAFANFTQKLVANEETMKNIRIIFLGVFNVVKVVLEVFKTLGKALFSFDEEAGSVIDVIIRLVAYFAKIVYIFTEVILKSNIIQVTIFSLVKIFKSLFSIVGAVFNIIARAVGKNNGLDLFISLAVSLANALAKLADILNNVAYEVNVFSIRVSQSVSYIPAMLMNVFRAMYEKFIAIGQFVMLGFSNGILSGIKSILIVAKNMATAFIDLVCRILGIHSPSKVFYKIGQFIMLGLKLGLKIGFASTQDSMTDISKSFIVFGKIIRESVVGALSGITLNAFQTVLQKIGQMFVWVKNKLVDFGKAIIEFVKGINWAKVNLVLCITQLHLLVFSLSRVLLGIGTFMSSMGSLAKSVKGFKDVLADFAKNIGSKQLKVPILLQFAIAIGTVVAAILLLGNMPEDKLNQGIKAILTVMGGLAACVLVLGLFSKKLQALDISEGIASIAKVLTSVAILLAAFVIALKVLENVKNLEQGVITIAKLCGILVGTLLSLSLISKFSGPIDSSMAKIVGFSLSVWVMANSLQKIASIPTDGIESALFALTEVCTILMAVGVAAQSINVASVIGLVILIHLIAELLGPAAEALGNATLQEQILAGVVTIASLITLSVLTMNYLRFLAANGKDLALAGSGIALMSSAFLMMAASVWILAGIPADDIGKGLLFLSGFAVLITVMTTIMIFLSQIAPYQQSGLKALAELGIIISMMTACVGMLALFTLLLQDVNPLTILASLGGFAVVLAVLSGVISNISTLQTAKAIGPLAALTALIAAIAISIGVIASLITENNYGAFIGAASSLIVTLVVLGLVFKEISRLSTMKISGVLSITVMIGAVFVIAYSLKTLTETINSENASYYIVALSSLLACLGVLAAVFQVIGGIAATANPATTGIVIAMVVSIAVMAGALWLISLNPWQDVIGAMGALCGCLMVFALACTLISTISANGTAVLAAIPLCLGIVVLGFTLAELASLPIDQMIAAAVGLSMVFLALGVAFSLMGLIPGVAGVMAAFALAMISFAASLYIMGNAVTIFVDNFKEFVYIDWKAVLKGIGCLMAFSAAMSALLVMAPIMLVSSVALIAISAALLIFGTSALVSSAGLNALAEGLLKLNEVNLIGIAIGLSVLVIPLTLFGVLAPVLILTSIALLAVGAGLAVLSAGLDPLNAIDISSIAGQIMELATSCLMLLPASVALLAASAALLASVPALAAYAGAMNLVGPLIAKGLEIGFGQIMPQMVQAGVDAVNGLIAGVQNASSNAQIAGGNLGQYFLNGFKKITGWHSPWATTFKAGIDAVTGLANGSNANAGQAAAAGAISGQAYNYGLDQAETAKHSAEVGAKAAKSFNEGLESQKAYVQAYNKWKFERDADSMENYLKVMRAQYMAGELAQEEYSRRIQEIKETQLNGEELAAKTLAEREIQIEYNKYKEQVLIDAEAAQKHRDSWVQNALDVGRVWLNEGNPIYYQAGVANALAYDQGFEANLTTDDLIRNMMGYDEYVSDSRVFGYYTTSQYMDKKKQGISDEDLKKEAEKAGYVWDPKKKVYVHHVKGSFEIDTTYPGSDDGTDNPFGDTTNGLGDMESAAQSLNDTIKSSIKIFERFKDITNDKSLTGNKLLGNMQSQIDAVDNWAADLGSLRGKISEGLYSELLNEGVDSYDKVYQLMDMSEAELWYASELYAQQTTKSVSYAQQLSAGLADVTVDADMLSDSFMKMNPQIKMTGAEVEAMRTGLSDYALKLVDANDESAITVEQVKQMGAQFLAANPKLRAMGMTADDVAMQIMHISTEVNQMADDIKDSLEGSVNWFESYSQSFEKTPLDMQRALDTQLAGMAVWQEDMVKLANRGVSEGILKELREMGIQGSDITRAFVNMTDEQLARYQKAFEEAQGKPEEFAKVMAMAMHGANVDMKNEIDGMTAEMVLLKYQISDTIKSSMDAFEEFDLKSSTSMQEMTKNLLTNLKGTSDWALDMEKISKRGINDGLLKQLQEAGPKSAKYVKALANATNKEFENYNKLFYMQSQEFSDILAKMIVSGDEKSRALATKISKNLEKIGDATFKSMHEVKESLKESISSSIDMFSEYNNKFELTPEKALANVKSQVEGIKKWSANLQSLAGKGISDEFLQYLTDLGPSAAEQINAIAQMSAGQLGETDKYVREALQLGETESQKIVDKYKQQGRNFSDGIIEGMDINAIWRAYNEAALAGVDGYATGQDAHSPAVKAIEQANYWCLGISEGMQKNQFIVKLASRNLALAAVKEAGSTGIITKFKQIGANMAKGIVEGIKSVNVKTAALNVTKDIVNTFTTALSIHSPSRVMEDLSKFIPMGAANGILNNLQYVRDASSQMAEGAIEGFTDTYSGFSSIIDFDNLDLTIRPTMDLSNITDGVRRIGEMFNQEAEIKARANINSQNQNGGSGQGSMTFVQNNYSPKALNRIEIYRQTRNQLSSLKGTVNA